MIKRIVALVVIFACSWTAWAVLTLAVHLRTEEKTGTISEAVGDLWGEALIQQAPTVEAAWTTETKREVRRVGLEWEYVERQPKETLPAAKDSAAPIPDGSAPDPGAETVTLVSKEIVTKRVKPSSDDRGAEDKRPQKRNAKEGAEVEKKYEVVVNAHQARLSLASTDVKVDLKVDHRKKGLLWFATYAVDYESTYRIVNPYEHPIVATVQFQYPSAGAVYDDMTIEAEGRDDIEVDAESGRMIGRFELEGRAAQVFSFAYRSRGMDRWGYRFGDSVNRVENFDLEMTTDFDDIDFPAGTISPDSKRARGEGKGWQLAWKKESLVSGLEIGMLMPHKINPGPLAASMSLHAPVSLFFFFFVLFMIQTIKKLRIHPMNYFFIAASFFAFNLLFSYLVSHMDIYLAFAISSAVSILLVVSYLRIVVGTRFALMEAALCQFAYQVLFSLAHFFDGYTGLTITIGAIVTLAIVMQLTAKIDWTEAFGRKNGADA